MTEKNLEQTLVDSIKQQHTSVNLDIQHIGITLSVLTGLIQAGYLQGINRDVLLELGEELIKDPHLKSLKIQTCLN